MRSSVDALTSLLQRAESLALQLNSVVASQRSNTTRTSVELVSLLQQSRRCASNLTAAELRIAHEESGREKAREARDTLRLRQAREKLTSALQLATQHLDALTSTHAASRLNLASLESARQAAGELHTSDRCNEEIQSLLATHRLLTVENLKMEQVLESVSEGSAALRSLHSKLGEVDATLSYSKTLVRGLLRVKTVDDVLLRLSWLVFFGVMLFVWLQRIFGLGMVVVV